MIDKKYFQEIPLESLDFISKLEQVKSKNFFPVIQNSTQIGKSINMGYLCYVLKIYKMTNHWKQFSKNNKFEWIDTLLKFQNHNFEGYENYFIDPQVFKYFNSNFSKFKIKNTIKQILNTITVKNYENPTTLVSKSLNADNKQIISTLVELDFIDFRQPRFDFRSFKQINDFLDSYDWSKPWDAGAQFSSISLYDSIFDLGYTQDLYNYITYKHDKSTGSYFTMQPESKRQVINGAMKVLTGLDWLNMPIHSPEKLIDFCLNNKPEFEGCDLVDYIYVLYKSSKETNYRKNEVHKILKEVLNYLSKLYYKKQKGFSYFLRKSQTHYYGINITKGRDEPDIHGTILSIWAIIMILDLLEINDFGYKVIKP